jgi:hypothetical protein
MANSTFSSQSDKTGIDLNDATATPLASERGTPESWDEESGDAESGEAQSGEAQPGETTDEGTELMTLNQDMGGGHLSSFFDESMYAGSTRENLPDNSPSPALQQTPVPEPEIVPPPVPTLSPFGGAVFQDPTVIENLVKKYEALGIIQANVIDDLYTRFVTYFHTVKSADMDDNFIKQMAKVYSMASLVTGGKKARDAYIYHLNALYIGPRVINEPIKAGVFAVYNKNKSKN